MYIITRFTWLKIVPFWFLNHALTQKLPIIIDKFLGDESLVFSTMDNGSGNGGGLSSIANLNPPSLTHTPHPHSVTGVVAPAPAVAWPLRWTADYN